MINSCKQTRATRRPQMFRLIASVGLLATLVGVVSAGQGCPFEDGSCQEYCGQQGCQMGYCGSFAWIQCICRRCGDEWNWYDKVRYNPDKAVNQTELDSLKLNGSTPLILTNSNEQQPKPAEGGKPQVIKATPTTPKPASQPMVSESGPARQQQEKPATLTTLLIPDLSDPSKLDLNDIPDENSEKFLDFLAKNHEKLAQATSARTQNDQQHPQQAAASQKSTAIELIAGDEIEPDAEEEGAASDQQAQPGAFTTTTTTPTTTADGEETVEIQVSSSDNSSEAQQQQAAKVATPSEQQAQGGPVTRLLRMAVAERAADELDVLEVE